MKIVIVGNGVAGITAARRVRELDPDASIEIYAREPYHYYYRPRLPELVAGEVELPDIILNPPEWYEERGIDVRLASPVGAIDPDAGVVTLESGESVGYDRLLVASGSNPFVPPVDGVDKKGVFTLRTADDAIAIREWANDVSDAVVVGGGLLGLETARGLRAAGLDVNVLERSDYLLPRQLDPRGAEILEAEIRKLGIGIVKNASTAAVDGESRTSGVVLEDGKRVAGGLVLFSTGVRCAASLAAEAGLETDRGIVVDCSMRTSAPDVYAAGDVASFEGVSWGIIPVALAQAEVAARTMTDSEGQEYCAVVPSNTLKITGIDVFSAGTVSCEGDCDEHVESDPGRGRYRKVVIRDGKIVGAIVIGSRKGVKELGAMIDARADVGKWGARLASEDFDFKSAASGREA